MTSSNLGGLNDELEAFIQEFSGWWSERGKLLDIAHSVSAPLYHYTSAGGLIGIFATQTLWLTSIFHLNDPSELSYGVKIALEELRKHGKGSNQLVQMMCHQTEERLRLGGSILGFFIGCFSRTRDELGQWRAYADDGQGVSIGISPQFFQPSESEGLTTAERVVVANVTYSRDQLIDELSEAINKAVDVTGRVAANILVNTDKEIFCRRMATELAISIFSYAVHAKHSAYENESETRLFLVNHLPNIAAIVDVRARGSRAIPYISTRLPVSTQGIVTEVVVGPAADEGAESAIRAILRSHGLPTNIVHRSDIPYRPR